MAELEILTPEVLTGIIEKYTAPPGNLGQSIFKRIPHPYSVAKWDVIQGNRYRATPTLPNREGRLVSHLGVGQKTASFIYVREKKAFEPTTLRWLREPGQLARANAEAAIRRELNDLNLRVERLVESYCWEALSGTIVVSYDDGSSVSIDLGLATSHKPTAATLWSNTSNSDVIGDVKAWKRLIEQDSGYNATDVYLTSTVMEYVYKNATIKGLFSERHKEQYLTKGEITDFLGLNWHVYDKGYVNASDTFVSYIATDHIIMIAKDAPGAFELLEGLSADEDAPRNHTGKFSKSWVEKDPSARFVLVEYNFIPVIKLVDAVVYAKVA